MTIPSENATSEPSLIALRSEIDRLDDALLALLLERADVVARLAASRSKGAGPPLRPGREALILRRLLTGIRGRCPAPPWCGCGARSSPPPP